MEVATTRQCLPLFHRTTPIINVLIPNCDSLCSTSLKHNKKQQDDTYPALKFLSLAFLLNIDRVVYLKSKKRSLSFKTSEQLWQLPESALDAKIVCVKRMFFFNFCNKDMAVTSHYLKDVIKGIGKQLPCSEIIYRLTAFPRSTTGTERAFKEYIPSSSAPDFEFWPVFMANH